MNVDLIDMNAFMADEPQEDLVSFPTRGSDGSDSSRDQASTMLETVDFLQDDEIGLRDHSESQVITPISNPYSKGTDKKPEFNLVSSHESAGQDDFLKSSRVWRCLSCLHLGEYS